MSGGPRLGEATVALALLLAGCAREREVPPVVFDDVTAAWGLDFVHEAGRTPEKHLPEAMGHGAALLDADADGDLDLYLVQGGALPPGSAPKPPPTNALLLNHGDGRMEDATERSGAAAHAGYGMGAVAGDADGDGHADLFVTNLGPDVLLLGDGRGGFADGTRPAELADERWTTGAALFDLENDGDLDLYVAAYVDVDFAHPLWCGRREPGWRTVCHPDRYPGLQDRLWRNRGDGSFEERTEEAGVVDPRGKGLGVIASDLDADGFLDLYVANDSVENRLWHNGGDGTFRDATLFSGTGVSGYGLTEAGMGLASGDVEGDGDLDLYVTNFDHESNTLYRNDGGLLFADATQAAGLDAPTRLPVGFGTVLEDLDGDGDLDLAVANGHIVARIALYDGSQSWRQRAALFLNDGRGRFADASAAAGALCREPLVGRGLYAGDLDGDGDLDLVLTECGGRTRLLRNHSDAAQLVLAGLPRGARVRARLADGRELVREVAAQPSYLGQSAPGVHVGLDEGRLEGLSLETPAGREALPVPPGPGRHRLDRQRGAWRLAP